MRTLELRSRLEARAPSADLTDDARALGARPSGTRKPGARASIQPAPMRTLELRVRLDGSQRPQGFATLGDLEQAVEKAQKQERVSRLTLSLLLHSR